MEAAADEHLRQLGLKGTDFTDNHFRIHFYHRGLDKFNPATDKAILVLIHGYPQSSYMWRHIVKHLPKDIPLFIPDIPGYGQSTINTGPHDKRTIGLAILTALQSEIPFSSTPAKIVIAGHDRGARIAHRLAVDMPSNKPTHNLLLQGSILIDIVPTLMQWNSFSNPKIAAGNFHWPFLANVEVATAMITAQGGSKFCHNLLTRWSGSSASGKANLASDKSIEIHSNYFDNPAVVRASCEDYKAGANEDVDEQKKDQAEGRKIQGPSLVIYSKDYLGSRFDIKSVWEEWTAPGASLSIEAIGGGIGHFLCEEAPVETSASIEKFLTSLISK